ncbi:Abi family protein [Tamlana fucoidanivorans]|uniref:Abi family protein n=1 Tax=Allotamlana fucoidanivorans TaxID=2583814 RepID=A0A5C4SEF8_9FLAO|nr:Abi family protein [Tamlana fucoidanivorans]TNJ41353.1 Abi family protein [Tamlana fucoidanivorans]
MTKKKYTKPPISFQDQIIKLQQRGLTINDYDKALTYLQSISYYRLSAYFLPYQKVKDTFNAGVNFSQIIHTYMFDKDLRLLTFDCIERLEVAIRTQFTYRMALTYNDAHWQDNQTHFVNPYRNKVGRLVDPYTDLQNIISKAKTARKPEVFIKHYTDTYESPANPPAWMCFELLTMGELSHFYRGLKQVEDKKRIASYFGVHYRVFTSWLHSLTYVRNLCAHHSRLWNRDLAIEPMRLLKPKGDWIGKGFENNKRVFYFLSVIKYMLNRANPNNNLSNNLEDLFNKYPTVPVQYLGIPSDYQGNILSWRNEPLWN